MILIRDDTTFYSDNRRQKFHAYSARISGKLRNQYLTENNWN